MTDTSKSSNIKNGLQFGLIIGLVYCLSLFLRYNQTSSGPIVIGLIVLLFYLVVIGLLFFCGLKRRKELGGYITLKDAFQTMFVAILIGELIYAVFNVIYLKFIDPSYFDKFYASMEAFMEKTVPDESQRDDAMEKMKRQMDMQKEKGLTIQGIVLGYLMSVAITGVFAFVASLIIKKNKPAFETPDNFLS